MKLPLSSVFVVIDKSELVAWRVTTAPWMGRCWGAGTMPRTDPKMVAWATAESNVVTAIATAIERITLRVMKPLLWRRCISMQGRVCAEHELRLRGIGCESALI